MTPDELERAVDVLMRRTVLDRGLPETIADGDALKRAARLLALDAVNRVAPVA